MRKPITLTQHGNSVRVSLPPPSLRHLNWRGGTEVMFEVVNEHEIRIVELEHYMREHVAGRRKASQLEAPSHV